MFFSGIKKFVCIVAFKNSFRTITVLFLLFLDFNIRELLLLSKMESIIVEELVDIDKNFQIGYRHYFIFIIITLISIVQTILQIIYSIRIESYIYFFACITFGPFHLIAVILAILSGQ